MVREREKVGRWAAERKALFPQEENAMKMVTHKCYASLHLPAGPVSVGVPAHPFIPRAGPWASRVPAATVWRGFPSDLQVHLGGGAGRSPATQGRCSCNNCNTIRDTRIDCGGNTLNGDIQSCRNSHTLCISLHNFIGCSTLGLVSHATSSLHRAGLICTGGAPP